MVASVKIASDNVPYVEIGKHQLRLDLEGLDEYYQKRAQEELRETPENVKNGLCELREYVLAEKNLSLPIEDDNFLMKFLRPCKFYPDSAFKVLRSFYKFKSKHPKYGFNITPNAIRHVFDNEVLVFLPTRTPSGSRILLINAGGKWNVKLVSVGDIIKAIMVAVESAMMEPKTQVAGVQVILNMNGFSLAHVLQFSPSLAKMIVDWIQECNPVRLKGIHVVNQSVFFNMAYAIFKPFMGEKLKKRIHLYGSNKKLLCEVLSPEVLPTFLGGTETELEYPGCLLSELLFHYEETFQRFNHYCYVTENTTS